MRQSADLHISKMEANQLVAGKAGTVSLISLGVTVAGRLKA